MAMRQTILLVEDNDTIRKVLGELLEMKGFEVLPASSARKAFEISRNYNRSIHLLITDIVMPQTGGTELARKLANLRPEMKVLFISGSPEEEILRYGAPPVGAAFLQKPVSIGDLLFKIRELV